VLWPKAAALWRVKPSPLAVASRLEKERKMEPYSHFFQTLHDERSPTGHLGNGTHASILRAIVFHDATLAPLTRGASSDFAVIWDEDHDIRVIKAVEAIYRAGFLGSILMIGERKGTLNAIVSEKVQDSTLLSSLEEKLGAVAKRVDADPWSSSLRAFDSPNHEIIDDDHANVSLYLANLKMLWKLGVNVSMADMLRAAKHAAAAKALEATWYYPSIIKRVDELHLSVRADNCLKNDDIVYVGDLVQKTEAELLGIPNFSRARLNEIKEVLASMGLRLGMEVPGWPPEKIEDLANAANRKIRLVES
jgi:hypothetical protein